MCPTVTKQPNTGSCQIVKWANHQKCQNGAQVEWTCSYGQQKWPSLWLTVDSGLLKIRWSTFSKQSIWARKVFLSFELIIDNMDKFHWEEVYKTKVFSLLWKNEHPVIIFLSLPFCFPPLINSIDCSWCFISFWPLIPWIRKWRSK